MPPINLRRPQRVGTRDPFFCYGTASRQIAVSSVATDTIAIQSSHNFVLRYVTCQYDQTDWTFQINLTGLGRNLFDQALRGALLFGGFAAGAPTWERGMVIGPPMLIPANTTIVITTTNGATGALNIAFGFIGNSQGSVL